MMQVTDTAISLVELRAQRTEALTLILCRGIRRLRVRAMTVTLAPLRSSGNVYV